MKTDKQVFRIFEVAPEWIFELTRLASPGPCTLQSFTLKELEGRADGLVVPADPTRPLTVVEFQFQSEDSIYTRTVREMVAAQVQHGMRGVEGIIIFAYNGLDPKTHPWTWVVRSFAFDELLAELERSNPEHPLTAVFKPIFVEDDTALAKSAVQYYKQIKLSQVDEKVKGALLEVFVNWLEQRFREMTKQEIEAMLIGELPDLEETRSGKDLIAIGEKRGKAKSILLLLEAKHGKLPKDVRQLIGNLTSAKADRLLRHLPQYESLADVQAWLEKNG